MKLIVGLGNPGKDYEGTRHNIGFVVVDDLVEEYGGTWTVKKEWGAALAEIVVDGQKLVCVKPLLYMNRSGGPVQQVMNFYKITPENILVIHDEIDLPLAKIQLKQGGSSAGHNGLKDIIAKLGTTDFWRLRIGVDRPAAGSPMSVSDWVLGRFSRQEIHDLDKYMQKVQDLLFTFLR